MAGPGDEMAAAEGQSGGDLRASHADREQVIGTLKIAFVQGRLSEDELDARAGQAYASRTYAELAEVTTDIPANLTGARPRCDPWRATKISWGVVYALIVPGLCTLVVYSGSPAPASASDALRRFAVVYAVFWILGVSAMVASRHRKRSGAQPPPRSASGVGS
jgi:Domain of unknown function (DUF1707)